MRQSFVATWLGVTCIAGSNRPASTCDGVGANARVSSALQEAQGPQNRSDTEMLHLGQSKLSEGSDPSAGSVMLAVAYRWTRQCSPSAAAQAGHCPQPAAAWSFWAAASCIAGEAWLGVPGIPRSVHVC